MKVAVVGAGICGLYTARRLSEKGNDVAVFEKREKIGKEVCSGLFSCRLLDFFPESEKIIQNRIDSVLVHIKNRTIKIDFSKKFLVIDHAKLDNLAAQSAERSGVKIFLNSTVKNLPSGFDRIIGCDGASSDVRRILGVKDPSFRLAIQCFIDERNDSNFVEVWPRGEGFIWKIPRGAKTEFGIIGGPKYSREILADFLRKNKIAASGFMAAPVPSRGRGFLIPKNPLLTLCGDAAALNKPWSGGGVIWGLAAADMLIDAFPDFLRYRRAAKRFFYPRIIISSAAMKIFYYLEKNLSLFLPRHIKIDGDF